MDRLIEPVWFMVSIIGASAIGVVMGLLFLFWILDRIIKKETKSGRKD